MLSNAVLSCCRFETLSSVTVYFGIHSTYDVLPDAFQVLDDLTLTTPCLQTLSFLGFAGRNYQVAVESHPRFSSILQRLQSFKLHFVRTSFANDRPDSFFSQFIASWLPPVMPNLTNLVLLSDSYWGYWPKIDLSQLFFPHLQVLALGKYLFTHDWQLQWIMRHGKKIQRLYLYDCPIVFRACTVGRFDDDGYPVIRRDGYHFGAEEERFYSATWLKYLQEMTNSLQELQVFKMTHENHVDQSWQKPKRNTPYLETYEDMETSIQPTRYRGWHWMDQNRENWRPRRGKFMSQMLVLEPFDSDHEALRDLLHTVEARRRTKTR